jgi:hypothetical protein
MIRNMYLMVASVLLALAIASLFSGCAGLTTLVPDQTGTEDVADDDGAGDDPGDGDQPSGDDTETPTDDDSGSVPGVLQIKAYTDTLGQAARIQPSGQDVPDDVDVNLTPTEYTVAFKRIVLKQVDDQTQEVLAEVEVFSADTVDDALIVDLENGMPYEVLAVEELPAGTYNKMDIEVFYLDMTVATLYPGTTSYDIPYRMVFEQMGVLEPRDFLLYLEPAWMEDNPELAALITEAGWYWMEMGNPDQVVPVAGAATHPDFHVLDLFANDEFWSSEHKVLEGGHINPPLEYDPTAGGVVTIAFDVAGKFDFKDYHDETTEPDGQWEIRKDGGIHPFPPDIECRPEAVDSSGVEL